MTTQSELTAEMLDRIDRQWKLDGGDVCIGKSWPIILAAARKGIESEELRAIIALQQKQIEAYEVNNAGCGSYRHSDTLGVK